LGVHNIPNKLDNWLNTQYFVRFRDNAIQVPLRARNVRQTHRRTLHSCAIFLMELLETSQNDLLGLLGIGRKVSGQLRLDMLDAIQLIDFDLDFGTTWMGVYGSLARDEQIGRGEGLNESGSRRCKLGRLYNIPSEDKENK